MRRPKKHAHVSSAPRFKESGRVERCAATVGGELVFLRRRRPDGSTYSIPVVVGGTRCTSHAQVTKFVNGNAVRRCVAHRDSH